MSARATGRAAVLASHGDRGGSAPNAALITLAAAVRDLSEFSAIETGVLKGSPSLETALGEAAAASPHEVLIYPLFMSDGYFTSRVLPERITAAGLSEKARILPPLGLDPELPGLVLSDALDAAARAKVPPETAHLLIVGHGSKFGPASAAATRSAARAIATCNAFASVSTAFLEEPPNLADVLATTPASTIVSGFFFGDGLHAGEDVPNAILAAGSPAIYAGAVGTSSRIAALVAAALLRALENSP